MLLDIFFLLFDLYELSKRPKSYLGVRNNINLKSKNNCLELSEPINLTLQYKGLFTRSNKCQENISEDIVPDLTFYLLLNEVG